MTVAEYIFDFLYSKNCNIVYMVSGSSAMWLTDALYRNKDVTAVCCHHEQAAAMAADGYGRVNEAPGACLVTLVLVRPMLLQVLRRHILIHRQCL